MPGSYARPSRYKDKKLRWSISWGSGDIAKDRTMCLNGSAIKKPSSSADAHDLLEMC